MSFFILFEYLSLLSFFLSCNATRVSHNGLAKVHRRYFVFVCFLVKCMIACDDLTIRIA